MQFTHYQLLGVSQAASELEIKKAYKRLALQYHPDRNQGSKLAEAHFIKINQANYVLSDPQRRARYDLSLRRPQRPPQARPTAQHYPPRQPTRPQYGYRTRRRPPQKSNWEEVQDLWKHSKYGKRVLLGVLLLYAGLLGFYNFMNHYTARSNFESGVKQEQQGNMLRAYGHYSDALHFDENYSEAFYKRAIISMTWMKNFESAYHDLDMAIVTNTEGSPAEWYHLRALTAIETGRYANAIKDLEHAIDINGRQQRYLNPLAHTYAYFADEPNKALAIYENMVADSQPKVDMAFSHIQLLQYDEAIALLNSHVAQHPADAPPFYYRGQAHLFLGDTLAACSDWQTALDLGLKEAEAPIGNFCR